MKRQQQTLQGGVQDAFGTFDGLHSFLPSKMEIGKFKFFIFFQQV